MQGHTTPVAEFTGTAIGMIVGHIVKDFVRGQAIILLGRSSFSRITGYVFGLTAGILAFSITNLMASTIINALGLDLGGWVFNVFGWTPIETAGYGFLEVVFDLAKEGLDALT